MPNRRKARALAASLRLPNLPSVWSNVLTGCVTACFIFEVGDPNRIPWALVASSCLYFSGNLLNDWVDLNWDKSHRPERALPAGLFSASHYLWSGMLLIGMGLGTAALCGPLAVLVALFLLCCILIYTRIHKHTAWSVIPMALCRASLPILGYCACASRPDRLLWIAFPAGLLFIHLVLLSLRARSESRSHHSIGLLHPSSLAFLLPPILVVTFWYFPHFWTDAMSVAALSSLPYLIWMCLALTRFRDPVSRQVSALLAGIPLVDALFLLPYALMGFLFVPNTVWLVVAMAWLPAFVVGRLLQRWVPAT